MWGGGGASVTVFFLFFFFSFLLLSPALWVAQPGPCCLVTAAPARSHSLSLARAGLGWAGLGERQLVS